MDKIITFRGIRENTFAIIFANGKDRDRVLAERPWLFDNNLFVLRPFDVTVQPHLIDLHYGYFWIQLHNLPMACMNRQIGKKIGSSINQVVKVDIPDDELGWGKFLRV